MSGDGRWVNPFPPPSPQGTQGGEQSSECLRWVECAHCTTATHGAFGALAFGIGTSEVEHVLARLLFKSDAPPRGWVEFRAETPFWGAEVPRW